MTKEYLYEKKTLDQELESVQEDIERIEEELAKIPTMEGFENLEEMAASVRELLGSNIDISDQDKRKIMGMLNLKVLITPDRKMKVEGWFTSQNGLLDTSRWSLRDCKTSTERLQTLGVQR